MNFVEELRWRGMLHDIMPGTEELLNKGMAAGYIGFDPTADSMHVGNLAQVIGADTLSAGGAPALCVGRWSYRYGWRSVWKICRA